MALDRARTLKGLSGGGIDTSILQRDIEAAILTGEYVSGYKNREEFIIDLVKDPENADIPLQTIKDAVYALIPDATEDQLRGRVSATEKEKAPIYPLTSTAPRLTARQEAAKMFDSQQLPEGLEFNQEGIEKLIKQKEQWWE
jgi:hypothetical protein